MDNLPAVVALLLVLLKKPVQAVISPPAEELGKDLRLRVQEMSEARRRNLVHHVEQASKTFGDGIWAKVGERAEGQDWVFGVSGVDVEDEALSAIWLAALSELADGGSRRAAVLAIAKKMRPDDAEAFERVAGRRLKPDGSFSAPPSSLWAWLCEAWAPLRRRSEQVNEQIYLQRFIALDLAHSPTLRLKSSGGWKLAMGLAAVLGGTWLVLQSWGVPEGAVEIAMSRAVGVGAALFALMAMLVAVRVFINPPELTPHGEDLARAVLQLRARRTPGKPQKPRKRRSKAKGEKS